MRSYIVNENYIGSAVSEIFKYKHRDILLLLYKDYFRFVIDALLINIIVLVIIYK